jgi:hypothetical protein
MRSITCKLFMLLFAVALFLPATASAQIPLTGVQSVGLSANLPESLTISLTGASSVTFNPLLPAGVTAGIPSVGVQTTWVLNPSRGSVKLVGYFSSVHALTEPTGPSYIDVANVLGKLTGGTGSTTVFTPFTGTVTGGIGIAGASLLLFEESISGTNKNRNRIDTLDLEIDLTSVPQQPAGAYTGTLNIQAIVL